MPYKIDQKDGKYRVVNPESGRVYGTHDSWEEARQQQKALYANAGDEAAEGGMATIRALRRNERTGPLPSPKGDWPPPLIAEPQRDIPYRTRKRRGYR